MTQSISHYIIRGIPNGKSPIFNLLFSFIWCRYIDITAAAAGFLNSQVLYESSDNIVVFKDEILFKFNRTRHQQTSLWLRVAKLSP